MPSEKSKAAAQRRLRWAQRPIIERVCACGCGTAFTTKAPKARFKVGHSLRDGGTITRFNPLDASEAEIAWAAGLFEGEGFFSAVARSQTLRYAQAGIKMTDKDILDRFHRIVGVGTIHGPHIRPGIKPFWEWQAGRYEDVRDVAVAFADWLGPRRLVQAASVLAQDTRAMT